MVKLGVRLFGRMANITCSRVAPRSGTLTLRKASPTAWTAGTPPLRHRKLSGRGSCLSVVEMVVVDYGPSEMTLNEHSPSLQVEPDERGHRRERMILPPERRWRPVLIR